jgi:glycosyltransferase involved in cell wall biosynthesis
LLSTADWDNPFWTNKQHVAVELSRRGHRILYIDSLGLRRPSLSKKDFKRITKRVLKAVSVPKKVEENIWVWSPITLPWNNNKITRRFNKIFFMSILKIWAKLLHFKYEILWTYNPLTTEFMDIDIFKTTVYHCVDEIKAQPGMPVDILMRAEKQLVEKMDVVFVTSTQLEETRKKWNDNVYYFSNVADFDHFNKAMDENLEVPLDLKVISKPILGFIGAISGYKVDFELLSYVATAHPEWNIVLIGDIGEGDPWTNASLLRKHINIHLLGSKKYEVLPNYLKGMDVALLPNQINEYTDSMFPMKFFEYLAAGKPVVSVNLKAIQAFNSVVKIGKTYPEFVNAIEQVLSGNVISIEERLSLAGNYTYESRTEKMLNIINGIKNK